LVRKFSVDDRIFEMNPGLTIGIIVCKGIDNSGESVEIIDSIRQRESEIREHFKSEKLSEHPKLAPWREAYRKFGGKPKKNHNSIEGLLKRCLKGENLRHISKLVDVYNFVSLKYVLPAGGEDLDKVKGDIKLTLAEASEPPVLLLGEKEPRSPKEGEVIYKDEESAVCRRFNWKEAERTKLTEDSKNVVLVIECLPPATWEVTEAALTELRDLVEKHCGGELRTAILERKGNEAGID